MSALALGAAGCGPADSNFEANSRDETDSTTTRDSGLASWTVFVYGHADHNLSATFVADLAEMSAAKISADIQVIVLADFDASQKLNGKAYPSGWQLYRIAGERKDLIELESGPEKNLDDPEVLAGMTEKVFRRFSAQRRAVIMWDHGGGWSGGFGGDTDNGTRTGQEIKPMRIIDVMQGLERGLRGAGISKQYPLDLLAFDTCLMAGAEVMTEAQSLASVYIANAELDYGRGWDYAKSFSWLSVNPEATVSEFAKAEVQIWDEHHRDASPSEALFRAHGAFDLEKWPGVVESAADFARASASSVSSAGRQGYFTVPTYNSGLEFRMQDPNLRDAGHFAERLTDDERLSRSAAALKESLASATLGLSLGSLREELGHRGIHVELTTGKAFERIRSAYATLAPAWSRNAEWSNLLQTWSDADEGCAPDVQSKAIAPGQVHFRVGAADSADARLTIGARTDSGLVALAPLAHEAIAADRTYVATWNGYIYVTGDDQQQQRLSVTPWLSILGNGSRQIYSTLMQTETGEELAFLFAEGSSVAEVAVITTPIPAVLTAEEIATVMPDTRIAPIYRASTGTRTVDALGEFQELPKTGLPIRVAAAAPGNYVLLTTVSDYRGNVTQVETDIARPELD